MIQNSFVECKLMSDYFMFAKVKYMKSKRFRSTKLSTYNKVQTGHKP